MNCPNCGEKTFVQESRRREYTVFRVRKCPACKYRFRTCEAYDLDDVIMRNFGTEAKKNEQADDHR